jgi:hypothetical protein
MILPKPCTLSLNVNAMIMAFIALLLLDASIIFEVEVGGNTEIVKEDQALENYQVILLFISGAVYLQTLFYAQKGQKLFPAAGALLCFSFILRELDVEKFDLPEIIILLGHGLGRNIMLIGLWLLLAVSFARNYKHYLGIAVNLLMTRSALLMVAGGLLLIVGDLFEDKIFGVTFHQLYEELSELNGYFLILLAALSLSSDLLHNNSDRNNFPKALLKRLNRVKVVK